MLWIYNGNPALKASMSAFQARHSIRNDGVFLAMVTSSSCILSRSRLRMRITHLYFRPVAVFRSTPLLYVCCGQLMIRL